MNTLPETNRRRRGHGFYPTKAARLPALYGTDANPDPMVRAHYFVGSWDWYVVEYDPETGDAFGFVKGIESEMGYFSLVEMESVLARGMFPIERDMHWDAVPLSTLMPSYAID